MRWRFRPLVKPEVAKIFDYYEDVQKGLGHRFATDFEALLDRLLAFPESAREVHPRIRQATLEMLPYAVYYTVTNDALEVIAVIHFARHPNIWRDRL